MAHKDFAATAIRLHESDDVAVLKLPMQAGDTISNGSLEIRVAQSAGPGHKFALHEIADGAPEELEFLQGSKSTMDLSLIYPVDPKQLPKELAGVEWPPKG